MSYDDFTTGAIHDIFTQEVENRGGRIIDTFHQKGCLFVRSLLPNVADARPEDRMQGGIALRSTDDELWLHPYLFRQVCRNGAIMAQSIESLHIEYLGVYTLEEGTVTLRDAIARCSEQSVFAKSMERVQLSTMSEVDGLLNFLPHLMLLQRIGGGFMAEIMRRFIDENDPTHFGFMNAVTAAAREAADQEDRWRLEELGGGIGALVSPKQPSDAPGLKVSRREFAAVC